MPNVIEPVTWDELDTAVTEVFQRNDPMQGLMLGCRMDVNAAKIIRNITAKLSPHNKPEDMARLWFATGLMVGENRHQRPRIILPT